MIAYVINKKNRMVIPAIFSWVLLTVFSCATLANLSQDTQPSDYSSMMTEGHQHHSMGDMSPDDKQEMSCCEQSSIVLPLKWDKPLDLSLVSVTVDNSSLFLFEPQTAAIATPQSERWLRRSYPRIHLVHCTLLD